MANIMMTSTLPAFMTSTKGVAPVVVAGQAAPQEAPTRRRRLPPRRGPSAAPPVKAPSKKLTERQQQMLAETVAKIAEGVAVDEALSGSGIDESYAELKSQAAQGSVVSVMFVKAIDAAVAAREQAALDAAAEGSSGSMKTMLVVGGVAGAGLLLWLLLRKKR